MLHQHLLTRTVTGIHSANLRQRYVRFIHNQQKILGKIIYQRKRRLTGLTSCQMTRIVFDAGAVAHLLHHLQIVIRALLQTLCLQQPAMLIQLIKTLFQLLANIIHSAFKILTTRNIVARRENCHMIALCQNLTRQHIKFHNAVNLVIEHFNAHSLFTVGCWNNLNHITAHTEGATLEINIITIVLNLHQLMQNLLAVDNLPQAQRQHHIIILLRRT